MQQMKKTIQYLNTFFIKVIFAVVFLTGTAFTNAGSCSAQGWQWARGAGDIGFDVGNVTCTDASGNVYVGGYFGSASILVGTVTLVNSGGGDVFVAKYDPNGNFLWVQKIGGSLSESISGLATDPVGNVYATGYFSSPLVFVAPLTMTTVAGGNPDVFVGCFNSAGVPQWLNAYGGAGSQQSSGCAFSNSLNCLYVTGYYYTTTMAIGATTLNNTSASGKSDVFLAKFTAGGAPVWARTTGGVGADDISGGVAVDANGNPHFGGTFSPTLVLGPTVIGTTTITSVGGIDFFTAKYDAAGTFLWARGAGSTGAEFYGGIKVDGSGNVCFDGYYQGAPLVIGNLTLTASGGYDGFVAQYNSAGTPLWANKLYSAGDEYVDDITVDANNNIYVAGSFAGTIITIGTATLNNSLPGAIDAFVAKYNSAGVYQWAAKSVGTTDEWAYGVCADAAGNIFVTGDYNTAGVSFGANVLANNGGADLYLSKIGCVTPSITGTPTLCSGSSLILTGGGATTYTWTGFAPGGYTTSAVGPTVLVNYSATITYSVVGGSGICAAPGLNNFTVTVLPANVISGGNLNLLCGQKQIINASCTPSNPIGVSWSPTVGLTSSVILTPSVIAQAAPIIYTVTVNLNNGCIAQGNVLVTGYAPTPSICMVTVDSVGVNNLILWDMTASPKVDTFFVWRDIANNNYQLIGKVLKTAQYGEFRDTVRSLYAANGDPNVSSWRYKISYKDSCGFMSTKSPYHKTMFMQCNAGNFSWNDYQIEGQAIPVPVLNNYIFRRDNLANGNWQNIQTLSSVSTAYTDPNFNTYSLTANWRSETVWGVQCNSNYLRSSQAASVKRSKSNVSNNRPSVGLQEKILASNFLVYPNPVKNILNIELRSFNENYEVVIENALGQIVYESRSNKGNTTVEVNKFAKGFYNLRISTVNASLNKKVIID